MAELGAFLGFNFEIEEIEIEFEDFGDFDDVVVGDELVNIIDDDAEIGVFANGLDIEEIVLRFMN